MNRLAVLCAALAAARLASAAVDEFDWQEFKEYPSGGKYYTDNGVEHDATIGKDGTISVEGLDYALASALKAMEKALQAEARLGVVENNLKDTMESLAEESETRASADEELSGAISEVSDVLAAHLNKAGDKDSATNFLATVAWTGKYDDLAGYPSLGEDAIEGAEPGVDTGHFDLVFREPMSATDPTGENRAEFGRVTLSNVAKTGAYTDLIFESAPISSLVTYEGGVLKHYSVTVNQESGRLEIKQTGTVPVQTGDGSCTCEGCGSGSGIGEELDPVFIAWRDGTWKQFGTTLTEWRDGVENRLDTIEMDISNLKNRLGALLGDFGYGWDPPVTDFDPPAPELTPWG